MIKRTVMALAVWASAATAQSALPFDLGGSYTLTNQYGETRTETAPDGRVQLVFFGYVNCPDICTAAFPLMADITTALEAKGHDITPIMITIAPDQDTVDTMQAPLAKWHPDFIGLTGDTAALHDAYKAFSVDIKPLFEDPEYGWIYAHGSFIHLLDADGKVMTLIPPIIGADQAVDIALRYLEPAS